MTKVCHIANSNKIASLLVISPPNESFCVEFSFASQEKLRLCCCPPLLICSPYSWTDSRSSDCLNRRKTLNCSCCAIHLPSRNVISSAHPGSRPSRNDPSPYSPSNFELFVGHHSAICVMSCSCFSRRLCSTGIASWFNANGDHPSHLAVVHALLLSLKSWYSVLLERTPLGVMGSFKANSRNLAIASMSQPLFAFCVGTTY